MLEEIRILRENVQKELSGMNSKEAIENFRMKYLVKKGLVQSLFVRLKDVPNELKPLVGKELNELRTFAEEHFRRKLEEQTSVTEGTATGLDITLPGRRSFAGTHHPVLQIMDRMLDVFVEMGFSIADGPEVEDGFHNFDALNFPPDHPARDMQDTFFIESDNDYLLRTHTSPVQIRVMKGMKPPIKCVMPGRVYRNESINTRSLAEFHQIEGLYIDTNVTFSQLKGTIIEFARRIYGRESKFRFRPSFFPFTEPSAEMDITCFLCGGKGCRVCKDTGWLEIVGCGMVHPNVLRAGEIDPEKYSGFAFGFGIERVALLVTGINDIRYFYDNDVRVLEQF